MSTEALVENGNFNEGVSGSNIWHAPSTHKRDYTAEFTKQLVKNWRRYSSLKICKNEMSEIMWSQSHLEKTVTIIQSLFLEWEMAENMDPRTDHTSAVRSRLLNVLSLRIQALSSQNVAPKLSNSNASATLPPIPSTEEPATGMPRNGFTSLPHPPSHAFALSGPEAMHRALTPIVESGVPERDPSWPSVNGATDNIASSPLSQEAQNKETNASSSSQLSPLSAYSPTEATSVPVTPPLEPVSEMAYFPKLQTPHLHIHLNQIAEEIFNITNQNIASVLSVSTVCLGSDQNIQHFRTHHSTKTESGQLEWEVVWVNGGPLPYDVHDTDQIPRTLSMIYCFCLYLYTTNNDSITRKQKA
jgi:hypothetical protein